MISHTGWNDGESVTVPVAVRRSSFSGSIYDGCGCGSSCYDYTYNGAYFSAPGFSASIWDSTYDYGDHVEYNAGASAYPSGRYGWMPNSHIPEYGSAYYNYYYDYYYGYGCGCYYGWDYYYGCGCYYGWGYDMPSGYDSGPIKVPAVTASRPDFTRYVEVNVEAWLPPLEKPLEQSLIVEQRVSFLDLSA